MSRGSLANGGISNEIGGISYKADAGVFVGRFFFDVLFFLLISLYIGKMFLSFIIDTFGELRSDNAENTNDKENVCFICQIGRDECLMKNIDFDSHIKYVHNMWNYVYYLNYLYVNNPFNFNWIGISVFIIIILKYQMKCNYYQIIIAKIKYYLCIYHQLYLYQF